MDDKLNLETLRQFIIDYKEIFHNFERTRNKKLCFIEEKDLSIPDKRYIFYLSTLLYKKFSNLHDTYISHIEFIFTTKVYYKLRINIRKGL